MNTLISRLLIGASIALVGVALLLDGLNIIDTGPTFKDWWPMLIIIGGLAMLISDYRNFVWPIAIIAVGGFLQMKALGYYEDVDAWQIIWPFILIVIGISIVVGRSVMPASRVEPGSDDVTAILGGSEQKNLSEDFTGSRARALMGGAKIDLRKATIKKEATVEVLILMGGIELVVPRNVIIRNQTNAILGGVEDSTDQETTKKAPVLTVVGDVIMGGIEIKN